MRGKKLYEWALLITYLAMLALFAYLNFTPGHREGVANIAVNAAMFVIVAIIFISADFGSFTPMNSIIHDLNKATEKIKSDALNTHTFLWEPYRNNQVEMFRTKRLNDIFRDYVFELNRSDEGNNRYYKPSIDDYINTDLVDTVMHRNELNQVSGMLTGLGILGTFIGLSLGLQSFNTGTTAQMTESIEPLMEGIKVAFHTSIYGMVFSLVFNVIYKRKLYEAETAVDNYVSAFKKYVLPDTTNDGMNVMVEIADQQLEAINNLTENMASELYDMITPHLDKLHETIVDFENMATRSQADAMRGVVEYFVAEMNKSLGQTFDEVHKSVDGMYQCQSSNISTMQQVLKATSESAGTLESVNRETDRLVLTLNKYSEGIQSVLDELQKTIAAFKERDEGNRKILIAEQDMLLNQKELITGFEASISEFAQMSQDSNSDLSEALKEMSDALYHMQRAMDKQQPAKANTRR